jgi:RNA polymerase sigma factor (sigma-70 family)
LIDAKDPSAREYCWDQFVSAHSRLILHVARSFGGEHDAAMDRYAFVLERLRDDDYRRLRTYIDDGRSEFSTWLVVVTQRLCRDHQRRRYGRVRAHDSDSVTYDEEWAARRRLVDLIGVELDISSLTDEGAGDAESKVRVADLYAALESALGQLERRDRLLIKLRYEDDIKMPEVANLLGFSTRFHAYRRLREVLSALRTTLERQGVGEAAP